MNLKYLNQKDKDKLFNDWVVDVSTCAAVMLPGGCNAKCQFCYDLTPRAVPHDYKERLKDIVLNRIPPHVRKIAISGMETTVSPVFKEVLELLKPLKNTRFDMIFLNTNGARLATYAPENIYKAFHALNVSRHAPDDETNTAVFGTSTIPSNAELKAVIKQLSPNMLCNVNCVVSDLKSPQKTLDEMTKFAKDHGFYSLALRFPSSETLYMGDLPAVWDKYKTIKYGLSAESRFWLKKKDGFPFVIRASVLEPKNLNGHLFGYIVQPDLSLTQDWAGKIPHKPMNLLKTRITRDVV